MKVHISNIMQNYNNARPDWDVFTDAFALSEAADKYDYESVGCVEHHFDPGYSMCPDNTMFLAHLAARTTKIKMQTSAVILPWNDPLRVVEKIALLDNIADGRLIFGMGRGLARREFEGFGIDMSESRARFDESAEMVLRGLEAGYVEGDGEFYKQRKVDIHPKPTATFKGRMSGVAMSPDSAVAVGKLGVAMMAFVQGPIETMHLPMIEQYREAFKSTHSSDAPPIMMVDLTYCHRDSDEAARVAREAIANYYMTCMEHYEFGGRHFEKTNGYGSYAAAKEAIDALGIDAVIDAYVNGQIWGTPEQIIERHVERKSIVGEYEPIMVFQYGGVFGKQAEESFRLFSDEVLPVLRSM